jgi:hypothetical protein
VADLSLDKEMLKGVIARMVLVSCHFQAALDRKTLRLK